MQRDSFPRFARWVLGANLFVIVWGAFVRATGSGDGCGSDWPLCKGDVVPGTDSAQTLIEYAHRASSGLVFVLGIALLVFARRLFEKGHPARLSATWAFVFLVTEAGVGAGLVLLELVGTNESTARVAWMVLHLVNTFLLLGFLAATIEYSSGLASLRWRWSEKNTRRAAGALLGVLLIGMTGAVTALGDTLYPASSIAQGLDQDVAASSLLVRLRVIHPVLAVAIGALLLGYAQRVRKQHRGVESVGQRSSQIAVLVWIQFTLGALNVILLVPIWAQLGHILLADLLWLALVSLVLRALAARESTSAA